MSNQFSGARLRTAREAAGLSAERLAIAVYPSPHTIEAYENGRAVPPPSLLVRLAAAVNVEPTDLFSRQEVPA
jgi:transcriptional regulator with XRE-family HTH domain